MLGMIVLDNKSGIGIQTRRLAYMLRPDRLLVVNSSSFSKNKKQMGWYNNFSGYKTNGIPTNREINIFLHGLTHVFFVETPLNHFLYYQCSLRGIKTYCQSNYEYLDHLNNPLLPLPHKFILPTDWMKNDYIARFGENRIISLPPPIDANDFKIARDINLKREGKKYLHIVGTLVNDYDRNGTLSLIKAVQLSRGDFELTIRSQHELPRHYIINDKRIKYDFNDVDCESEMYKDFDALIMPRRYGGLCLPSDEALLSGLPVVMLDIEPYNNYLPKKWVISANMTGYAQMRTKIPIYTPSINKLVEILNNGFTKNDKLEAFEIGYNRVCNLKQKYDKLWTL